MLLQNPSHRETTRREAGRYGGGYEEGVERKVEKAESTETRKRYDSRRIFILTKPPLWKYISRCCLLARKKNPR